MVGETIMIGVEGSQQLGIYSKLMEQARSGRGVRVINKWVRVELRLWAGKAALIATQIVKKRPLKAILFESSEAIFDLSCLTR